jgi:carboxypeptidase PM20D1
MRRVLKIIRNVVLLLVAGIVVLAGVLAYNVVTRGSRQAQVAVIPRTAVDTQGAAKRLSEAIRFQTISNFLNPEQDAEALRGLRAHIESSFPAFHAAAKREVIGGHSLLYMWEGADSKARPIALLAHQDVVPVAPGTEKDRAQPDHPRDISRCRRVARPDGRRDRFAPLRRDYDPVLPAADGEYGGVSSRSSFPGCCAARRHFAA